MPGLVNRYGIDDILRALYDEAKKRFESGMYVGDAADTRLEALDIAVKALR